MSLSNGQHKLKKANNMDNKLAPEWNEGLALYANSSIEDVLKKLETSSKGLSQPQANKRLTENGRNELQNSTITWFDVLKNQLKNPFLLIFIVIAIIYVFTKEYTESVILLIICSLIPLLVFIKNIK